MRHNPYEFQNTDEPAVAVAVESYQRCPEFPREFTASGRIDEAEARRMVRKVKRLRPVDPKTGRPPNAAVGWMMFWGVLGSLAYVIGSSFVKDLRAEEYTFANVLFWLTSLVIPGCVLIAVVCQLFLWRAKVEDADPPIWGDVEVKFTPQFYVVKRCNRAGYQTHQMYSWAPTDVRQSCDAWLLSRNLNAPVLIPRDWLTIDQQEEIDCYLKDLIAWRASPDAQRPLPEPAEVFGPLPENGVRFRLSDEQYEEFETLKQECGHRYPKLLQRSHSFQVKHIAFLCAVMLVNAAIYPIYAILVAGLSIGCGWVCPAVLGACFAWMCSAFKKGRPAVSGMIADSALWTEGLTERFCFRLNNFSHCEEISGGLLLVADDDNLLHAVLRSSFAADDDWHLACQQIRAAVRAVRP